MIWRRGLVTISAVAVLAGTFVTPVGAVEPGAAGGPTVRYRTVNDEVPAHDGARAERTTDWVSPSWRMHVGASTGVQSPSARVAATAPSLAAVSGSPQLQATAGRAGLSDATSGPCPTRPCIQPANPTVAANATRVVQIVDGYVRVTDRSGAIVGDTMSRFLFDLASQSVDAINVSVVWDGPHQRWVYAAIVPQYCDASILVLATAPAADPLGTETAYAIVQPGVYYDDPWLGISSDKVVVGVNQYAVDATTCDDLGYLGASLQIVDWADLTNGGELTLAETAPDASLFAWRPARNLSTAAPVRSVVGVLPASGSAPLRLALSSVNGSVVAESIAVTAPSDLVASGKLVAMSWIPDPYQAGTPKRIAQPLDERPLDAIWIGSSLWFTQQVRCQPPGDAVVRACARIVEYKPSTATVRQDFLLGGVGHDAFAPGITFAANGRMFIAYTRSSSSTYLTPFVTTRDPNDPVNTVRKPAQVAVSAASYRGSRWGEAVMLAPDPTSSSEVWGSMAYVDSAGGWQLWTSRFSRQTGALSGGSITIAGGAAIASPKPTLSIVLPSTGPVTLMRLSNVSTTSDGILSKSRTYTARRSIPWSLYDSFTGGTGAQGSRTVYLQFGDGAGAWGPVLSDSIVLDLVAPTAPGPAVVEVAAPSLVSPSDQLNSRLTWSPGADSRSAVRYELQGHQFGNNWAALDPSFTIEAGRVVSGQAPGSTDYYRVRAVDAAGNPSAWVESLAKAFKVTPQNPAEVFDPPAPGGETAGYYDFSCPGSGLPCVTLHRPIPDAPGGAVTFDTALSSLEVSGLGVVVTTCPSCGKVELSIDGGPAVTLDLAAGATTPGQLVWIDTFDLGSHAITIRAGGTGAGAGDDVRLEGYVLVRNSLEGPP